MGSRVSPNVKCWQFRTPYCSTCDSLKTPRAVPSSLLRHASERNNAIMPCGLVHRSTFSGSRSLKVQRGKRAYSALFDDFHHEEMMNPVQDSGGDENGNGIAYVVSGKTQNKQLKIRGSSEESWAMKPDVLEPSLLGIEPEPPSWPERDEILKLRFERKVNSVEIPLSIRMIKKKLQLEDGIKEAGELTNSSVKKTFSSMLFIMHELQNHALQTRESLCCEDLQSVMAKLRREMDASFVWLFQQVFCKTPTLMVHVMVLLANFSVFSMDNNTVKAVTPSSMITTALYLTNNESKLRHSQVDADFDQGEYVKEELTEEEEMLWKSMLEEASILEKELKSEVLDHETIQRLVAPVSVELEGDQYEEYVKTELHYKKHLLRTPHSSLLLSNYAQFLFLVLHDIDGSEEYYKRSVLVESPEAEAFSRYADFLLMVRKDVWAAELRYMQALEADPGNTYYLSKYASFLWNTGGQDTTSFPLEELGNLQL
ncbi:uncharacterized protein LOC113847403 [Abrus precatorius]|uniref:Uncharacterized protein LOC113847403 n=1 Tax=Abrus precatorius TaxID=3816 RepID=A0A8B8JLI0_ABRPR|nr:uncharacterized protein LOC113847403 [Abrus precatorius]